MRASWYIFGVLAAGGGAQGSFDLTQASKYNPSKQQRMKEKKYHERQNQAGQQGNRKDKENKPMKSNVLFLSIREVVFSFLFLNAAAHFAASG